MPTYNLGVPNPPNQPSVDVPKMQTNTNSISTWVNVDHQDFAPANFGTHKQVTLTNEAEPTIAPDSNGCIYSSPDPVSGLSWPVWVNAVGKSTFMMNNYSQIQSNGFTSLPGQIIVQWGNTTASGTGTRNVLFAALNMNFPHACFQVIAQTQITTLTAGIVWSVSNISQNGFSLGTIPTQTPSGTPFSWFAIGW